MPIDGWIRHEGFARTFAECFRLGARVAPAAPRRSDAPDAVRLAPRRSFWAYAKHPDVLLSGFAAAVVAVVLVAWLVVT